MKNPENIKELIASFPWGTIIDRIVNALHCTLDDLGRQVGVTRQAIEGYHSSAFSPKESTALALLFYYCQIAEPTCDSPDLLPSHGLAESDIRTLKQIAAGMQKKQQRLDSILKQKSELEVELRKTQIELLQERSSK